MLGQVKTINGQKQIVPITGDTGSGAPIGSYLYLEKKSNPNGYLYCDGSTFDTSVYPGLYQYLGSNTLPDFRECAPVGAEQNTTAAIATHDVYTEGEFKDDQMQDWTDAARWRNFSPTENPGWDILTKSASGTDITGRFGGVTRGKRKAVFVYIKATTGLTEDNADYVLNQLRPVDSVTDGNMKPVTSNAVYDALSSITPVDSVTDGNSHPVTSNAVYDAITPLTPVNSVTQNDLHPVTSNAVASYIKSGNQANSINDCNLATTNGIWYFINAANCPPASIGFSAPDNSGTLVVQAHSDIWVNQICQDFYSDGTIFIRSKKVGTWTPWRKVKVDDSSNNIPVYTIPSSLIGSGSVTLSVTFPVAINLYVYISNPSNYYSFGSIGITADAHDPGTLTVTNIFGSSNLANDILHVTKNTTNNTITIAATWSSGYATYNYTFNNLIVEGIGVNGFVV